MEKNVKEITKVIEGEKWTTAIEKAYQKLSKKVKIDGFRPGKAPKDVFIKKYGKENILVEAADDVMQNVYMDVLKENEGIELVAQPRVEIKNISDEKLELMFALTTKPEVKLGKYTSLGVKKEEVKVTKKEIEESIEHLRSHYAENVTKDGAVADGDIAIIDFEGFKDGVPFEGGKADNYSLKIGSKTFIPGFEEQIIGMKTGEEKDINVTFPEDYHSEDLKGAAVVFKVKVNEIKEAKIPELDKDFFEDLGMEGIDSKEALEKQTEENLMARKETEAENKYMDALLEAAAKTTEVDIPEVMIEDEINRMMEQYKENLSMQGITIEQFYKFTNSDENALKDQMKDEANKRVLYRLMLEEIAKKEKFEINDEEANKKAEELSAKYQMKKDEFLKEFGGLEMVKYDMKMHMAMETLRK